MNYKLACDSYFLPQAMDGGWAAAHKLFIAPVQQRWSSGCHHSLWDWKPEIEIMVERTNRTMPGLSDNRPAIRKVTKITIWLRSILSCATTTTTTMLMKRIHTLFIRFFDRSHTFSWNVIILSLSSISGHGIMKQGVFKVYPMRWAPPGYISKSFFFFNFSSLRLVGWGFLNPFFLDSQMWKCEMVSDKVVQMWRCWLLHLLPPARQRHAMIRHIWDLSKKKNKTIVVSVWYITLPTWISISWLVSKLKWAPTPKMRTNHQ